MLVQEKVLQIAKNELGYLEKASNKNLYDKTANAGSNNYTKYWADIAPSLQGQPWCACFITWCIVQATGKDNARLLLRHYPYISCPAISKLFVLNSKPKVYDIVIFNRNGTFTHTGLVTSVNGNTFTTIEGNTSGASGIVPNGGGVKAKTYNLKNLPNTKFITLNWHLVNEKQTQVKETPVNYTGIITASELNVRQHPTTDSTVLAKHVKGDIVNISAKTDNGWYKVIYPFGIGYLSDLYVKIQPIETKPVEEDLTDEEFAALMNNWFAGLAKEDPSPWSKEAREYVENLKIINGDDNGSMRYHSYLNREEMAQILFNLNEENII